MYTFSRYFRKWSCFYFCLETPCGGLIKKVELWVQCYECLRNYDKSKRRMVQKYTRLDFWDNFFLDSNQSVWNKDHLGTTHGFWQRPGLFGDI